MSSDHGESDDLNVATSSKPMSSSLQFSEIIWNETMNELLTHVWRKYNWSGAILKALLQVWTQTFRRKLGSLPQRWWTILSYLMDSSRQEESTMSLDCNIGEVNFDYIDERMKNRIVVELETLSMVCNLFSLSVNSLILFNHIWRQRISIYLRVG